MWTNISKSYIFLLLVIFSSSCRKQVTQLRSSVRKTQTEVRFYERTAEQIGKLTGGDKLSLLEKKSVDSINNSLVPMEQKSMLNSYGYLYDAINGSNDIISSRNFYYDSTQNNYHIIDKRFKKIKNDKEVFGWHPSWMEDSWKSYPMELLSTISFFSFRLDSKTGSYKNPEQINTWRTTAMIDSAQSKNVRVLLTVSLHGRKNNDEFLSDRSKWQTTIDTLTQLMKDRKADGIDLNFEQLPYLKRGSFTRFVKELDQQLSNSPFFSSQSKEPFISLTLPAVDSREIYDIHALNEYVDLFVIMGYDYNTGSQTQGAVAPLRSFENTGVSLSNTVNFYLDRGIEETKTILALPYYGSMWDGRLNEEGDFELHLERKVTYSEIRKLFKEDYLIENNIAPILEPKSVTNYLNLIYPDKTSKEVWFDDDYTLGKKYDYAISNKFKGIGIWALGYDSGYTELWDVIEDRFSSSEYVVQDPIATVEGYPIKISKFFNKNKDLFLVSIFFFTLAVVVGLLILISDWKVRETLSVTKFNKWIILALMMLFLTPLINYINSFFLIKSSWQNYIAFIVGGVVVFLAQKIKFSGFKRP